MNKKSYAGKWVKLGIDEKERNNISERVRQTAKHILSQQHKKEFKEIKKVLLSEEYLYYKELVKGGLKE